MTLDRLARVRLSVLGRRVSAFRVCGSAGIVAGTALALTVTARMGGSLALMGALAATAVAASLALVAARVVVTATETLVLYHQQLVVLAMTGVVAAAAGAPVLLYLDAAALGLGLFNACGRVGCLMVGCCHGRPGRWGIAYPHEHVDAGFDPAYAGIRLVPVQGLESALALAVTAAGTAMVLAGAAPGTALAWYACAYSAGRFGLETLRGDGGRRYRWSLSQPQRLALLCTLGVVAAEAAGLVPVGAWSLAAAAVLAAELVLVRRRSDLRRTAARPAHVRELVTLARQALNGGDSPAVARTSAGFAISGGPLPGGRRSVTLSHSAGAMDERLAADLTRVVTAVAGARRPELLRGQSGAYHVVLDG